MAGPLDTGQLMLPYLLFLPPLFSWLISDLHLAMRVLQPAPPLAPYSILGLPSLHQAPQEEEHRNTTAYIYRTARYGLYLLHHGSRCVPF